MQFKPHVWMNVHSGMEALFMPYDHLATIPKGPIAEATLEVTCLTMSFISPAHALLLMAVLPCVSIIGRALLLHDKFTVQAASSADRSLSILCLCRCWRS